MKAIKLVLPVVAMAALGGCVVTNSRTETRDYALSNFDSISAMSGIDVVVTQGPFAVKAEAPEGKLDSIRIEQRGSELRVDRQTEVMWFGSSGRYVVNVSAPSFVRISASGGADVELSGLSGESLSLSADGGGDIKIVGLQVTTLSASASGGGDVDLSGTCTTANLSASGGGDIDAESLICANVTASASGGGDVDAHATMMASGSASGGGDVRFSGSPPTFTSDESAGGSVKLKGR